MYTYDVENDISIFDGDFEGYLKDIGVDGEHIKKIVIQPSQVSMTRRRQKKVLANRNHK